MVLLLPLVAVLTALHAVDARLNHTKRATLAAVITSCTKPNVAALTFDDGPYIYNGDVLSALAKAGAKGTFFLNGNNYDCIYNSAATARVKAIYNAGHQVGSHTWSHPNLPDLNRQQITDQITLNDQAFQRILGVTPAFLRPPYGSYNDLAREVSYNLNKKFVTWDFDSLDSDGATVAQSKTYYDQLVSRHPSNVIALNHETEEGTAKQLLPYAIQKLQAAGYKLVTVADCLGVAPYSSIGSPQSGSFSCNDPPPTTTPPPTSGTKQIHPNGDTKWCAVPSGGSNANGVAVVLQLCSTLGTKWAISSGNTAVTTNNGAYAFDAGSSPTSGTQMKIWTSYPGLAAQNWYLTGDNRIALTDSGLCLDLPNGNKAAGQRLQLWKCGTGNNNQVWTLT